MSRFSVRTPRSDGAGYAVIDTVRWHRHVATCLTGELATSIAQELEQLRPCWVCLTSPGGRLTVCAEAMTSEGKAARAVWHIGPERVTSLTPEELGSVISLVEDMLYGAVARDKGKFP